MSHRPAVTQRGDETTRILDGGFWLVAVMAGLLVIVMLVGAIAGAMAPGPESPPAGAGVTVAGSPSASPAVDPTTFLYPTPRPAPAIELTSQDDQPFSLASLRGDPVLVFFGYTHCPDVCPATVGTVGLAMEAFGPDARAVFVTVDPERDTPASLAEYVRYLAQGFVAATGRASDIRATADAWGVRYARVETAIPGDYSMAHTADVYLVDPNGMLRAQFPFGTSDAAIAETLRLVVASDAAATATPVIPAASATSIPAVTPAPMPMASAAIDVEVTSSSIWAGGATPVIINLSIGGMPVDDMAVQPTVQLVATDGSRVGDLVSAVAVRPPGSSGVSYVASMDIPTAGVWQIEVALPHGVGSAVGTSQLKALDPGSVLGIGTVMPNIHTPTLADVGGDALEVTTDPAPDLRMSQRSTSDALAAHEPFVLVVDSARFRRTQACGRAIVLARSLLDRWPDVTFIHLEPFRYSVIGGTPVIDGVSWPPLLTDPTAALGIGPEPWTAITMPWMFIVDGDGIVRAKYRDVIGTSDIDVILSLISQGR